MTAVEFNEKYKDYLEEGHYGLDIDIPEVVEYLDKEFQTFIQIEGFKYFQIKLKFNSARFYFKSNIPPKINAYISFWVEKELNKIVESYYRKKQEENDN